MEHFDIQAWKKDRDEALASGDLDCFIAHWRKYNPDIEPPSREIVEIAMHKARTAALSLPEEEREKSRQWLKEQGYKAME